MELKVFKDTIASYGGRWETRLELPVETEILIPDYLPAVFKIVKCLITPVVLQNRVSGGRWQSEGYLRCTVYYQSEEPGTRLLRTEQKFAFEKLVELPAGQYADGPPRSGASRNTATAAPSVSTASTCAARTSSAPQWPCGGSPSC